jgi:NADH-quinone oxidoreductase subunit C
VAESRSHHTADAAQPDFDKLSQPQKELLALAEEVFQDFHPQPGVLHDLPQLTIEPEKIVQVCRLAKDEPRLDFKLLLCLTCVDYQEHFQMVYFLHSLDHEQTLVIKTNVSYADPRLPSVTSVWQAADWYEREAHDLFGVVFEGHPNLAPLLLYEEFEGYPGRKEYPFYEYQEF